MKKTLSRLSVLFVFIILIGVSVNFAFTPADAATYSGTCGAEGSSLTWSFNTATGELTISGSGDMKDYTRSSMPWYSYLGDVKTLSIGEGVTSIGSYAFHDCTGLSSITIPEKVTDIGKYAFAGCTGVENIYFNATNMRDLGSDNNIFSRVGQSTDGIKVVIGDDVLKLPAYLLNSSNTIADAPKITEIVFEGNSNRKTIGNYAFACLPTLTSVHIPGTVESIGIYAFGNCEGLRSVTIDNGVVSIGRNVFYGCSSLERITLPFVGNSAKKSTETYQYPFGYIFGSSSFTGSTEVKQYYYGSDTSSPTNSVYYIPTSLKEVKITGGNILLGAFYNCSNLTKVTLSDGVTYIGKSAFFGCSSLEAVDIPDTVTSIGASVFDECGKVVLYVYENSMGHRYAKSNTIKYLLANAEDNYSGTCGAEGDNLDWTLDTNTGVLTISGTGAMADYSRSTMPWYNYKYHINTVNIGDSVTSIGAYAFYDCANLTSVTVPEAIDAIGNYAFRDCTNVVLRVYESSVAHTYAQNNAIKYELIGGSSSVVSGTCGANGDNVIWTLDMQSGILTISGTGDMADYDYSSASWHNYKSDIKSVVIESGVASIGKNTFSYYTELESVTIGNDVNSIGSFAFYGCTRLTSVIGGNSVNSIDDHAFDGCLSLTSITIPDSVTSIGICAFFNCTGLNVITIPNSVTSIGDNTFCGCTGLTRVVIGNGVESIGDYAFASCSRLSGVIIGNRVKFIGIGAFSDCPSLTSINLPEGVTSISSGAFQCAGLTSITVPESVTYIGEGAFEGCADIILYVYENSEAHTYAQSNSILYAILDGATVSSGTCGAEGNNLTWSFNTVTGMLSISGNGNMADYTRSSMPWNNYLGEIKTLSIGEGVTSIGEYALYNCTRLSSISIPEGVTSIGKSAFAGCTGATSITISNSITTIEKNAFLDCISVDTIHFNAANMSNLIADNNVFARVGQSTDGIKVIIGDDVLKIPAYLFNSSNRLENAPKIIDIIFEGNSNRKTIGNYAFACLPTLTSVHIPGTVDSIGSYAFGSCEGLRSVTIDNGVVSIGRNVFYGCSSLERITLPFVGNSVKKSTETYQYPFGYIFGSSNFTGSTEVKQYYYGPDTASPMHSIYYIPASLKEVKITGGNILLGAFYNCSNLTRITLSDNVTYIGKSAFFGCSSLKAVDIPENVTSIGAFAFEGCDNVVLYVYQNSIGHRYAKNNTIKYLLANVENNYSGTCGAEGDNLTWTLDTNAGKLTISGTGAMADYSRSTMPWYNYIYHIKTVNIDDGVTSIGEYAFYGCANLTSVTFPAGMTSVGKAAFTNCPDIFMYIYRNSPAYMYAKENAIGYELIRSDVFGDTNEDGVLSNADITLIIRFLSGWDISEDVSDDFTALDFDLTEDGTVNNRDAIWCIRKLAGWSTSENNNYLTGGASGGGTSFAISGIEMAGEYVRTTVNANGACTLQVQFLDEITNENITTVATQIPEYCELTPISILVRTSLPEKYIIVANLLDENGEKLCSPFTCISYTTAYENHSKQTVDDFAGENVINFDDSPNKNYGVLKDDVKEIVTGETANRLTVSPQPIIPDNYDGTQEIEYENYFIFENPDSHITSLVVGDKIYIKETQHLIKIASIETASDGTVIMTASKDVDLTEFYKVLSVNMEIDINEADIDNSGAMVIWDIIDAETSLALGATIKLNPTDWLAIEGKLNGKGTIKIEVTYDLKLFKKDYFYISVISELELNFKAEIKVTKDNSDAIDAQKQHKTITEIKLGNWRIPTTVPGLVITTSPSIPVEWELSAGVTFDFTSKVTSGFSYSSYDGKQNIDEKSQTIKVSAQGEATIKAGPQVELSVGFCGEVLKASLTVGAGIEAKIEAEYLNNSMITTANSIHACTLCLEGTLKWYVEVKAEATYKVIRNVFEGSFGEWNIVDIKGYFPISPNFYISIINSKHSVLHGEPKFGWGECPNEAYKTEIVVKDSQGDQLSNVDIVIKTSTGEVVGGGKSKFKTYLSSGDYVAVCNIGGVETAKAFKVTANAQTVTLNAHTHGTLSGKICKASNKAVAIPGAKIEIFKNGSSYTTKYANSSGNYSLKLAEGEYFVVISSEGYIDFKCHASVRVDTNTYMETFLMIEGHEDSEGTTNGIANGKIVNTLTGNGVPNVSLSIVRDWNNTDESADVIASTITDAYGNYKIELPIGNYTVIATKDNYTASYFNIIVQEGTTSNQNGTITPEVAEGDVNQYLITLTWDENPRDLDSHVVGTLSSGSSFHVYYAHKSQYDGDEEVCNLDYDDTTSYGPEHISLVATTDAPYYYYIHRYAGSGAIITSGAQITIEQGNTLIAKINVPTDLSTNDYWNVFAIKDGELIINNTITSTPDTSYAG